MDRCVTASTVTCRLQAEVRTAVRHSFPHLFRMATNAERSGISVFEHVARCRPMTIMTCQTAIERLRIMFIDERSLLILVAAGTEGLAFCPQLVLLRRAMRIMAVRTLKHTFLQPMVSRLIEVRALRIVTRQAEFALLAFEHGAHAARRHCRFMFGRWVNVMARCTSDSCTHVLAQPGMALFAGLLVTLKAFFGCFGGRETLHGCDGTLCTVGLQVLGHIAMAFSTVQACSPRLCMRRLHIGFDFILMTFRACLG